MIELKSFFTNGDDFRKGVLLSLALHLVLAVGAVIKANYRSKPYIDFSQAISVSVAEISPNTKIADESLQSMPASPASTNTKQPEPIADEKPSAFSNPEKTKTESAKKKADKSKTEINLAKSKAKQKAALKKIKKLAAIEKIKESLAKESATKTIKHGTKSGKTRAIAAGTTLTGLDKIDASQYLQLLDYNIKEVWTLPQWLTNKNLQTRVLVKFNTQGSLLSAQILQSSGNQTYDQYCLQAVSKAAPFPKVPEKFSEKFSIDGLVIGFPE